MRLPPKDIQILLPVWGQRYTRDFLELCLPSLLAPGNIPGLSKLGRCTFVLLAPARDAEVIERSPLWRLLLGCCSVRVRYIDDLISQSSSTVLTLVYAQAIRETGEQALDTCFVPLVADYILSDGSLLAVVKHIFAGASGVLAGNFQIAREAAFPCMEKQKSESGVLAIPSRTLVELALNTLHRTTLAEIVNQGPSLRPKTNRLFWRVDDHCMVGRFFLMHMIAIHPEISDFIITAPSDYSLIPELCPSGKIVRITDSDDYFVVECQPQSRDLEERSIGYIEPRSVAGALVDWATAMHHENARSAVAFHAGAPPPRLAETVATSEAFVSEVEANRSAAPMPFRNHPIWRPALDHHLTTAQTEQDPARLVWITGDDSLLKGPDGASRLRAILLGRAPYFKPWHPRWEDVRMLKRSIAAARGDVAFVSDASARVQMWFHNIIVEQGGLSTIHLRLSDISKVSVRAKLNEQFDALFFIADEAPAGLADVLSCLEPLLRPHGTLVLSIGRVFDETEHSLDRVLMPDEAILANPSLTLEEATCVTASARRVTVQTAMMRSARRAMRLASIRSFLWFATAGGLAVLSMFFNVAARQKMLPKPSQFSSLFLTFSKVEN
jgi:hypothetical protein